MCYFITQNTAYSLVQLSLREFGCLLICPSILFFREHPKTGQPTLCRFAAEVRCSSFNQPIEVVEAWYDAFRRYWQILEENSILIKSAPGMDFDIAIMLVVVVFFV